MSKDKKVGQRATRQHPPTKIIVERHYVGEENPLLLHGQSHFPSENMED